MPKKVFPRVLNVTFTEELFVDLQKAATTKSADEGRFVSMNEIVRTAVKDYLVARARRIKGRP